MKVITIREPWATLIANGYKRYEFRSWKTNYRGIIYIHAGKGKDLFYINKFKNLGLKFSESKIVARASIVDCIKIDNDLNEKISLENNFFYGSDNIGNYAWVLDNIEVINSNKYLKGQLGIFEVDDDFLDI